MLLISDTFSNLAPHRRPFHTANRFQNLIDLILHSASSKSTLHSVLLCLLGDEILETEKQMDRSAVQAMDVTTHWHSVLWKMFPIGNFLL